MRCLDAATNKLALGVICRSVNNDTVFVLNLRNGSASVRLELKNEQKQKALTWTDLTTRRRVAVDPTTPAGLELPIRSARVLSYKSDDRGAPTIYPSPNDTRVPESALYNVSVGGLSSFVYFSACPKDVAKYKPNPVSGDVSFTSFALPDAMGAAAVLVLVSPHKPFKTCVVRPLSLGIACTATQGRSTAANAAGSSSASLSVSKPMQVHMDP